MPETSATNEMLIEAGLRVAAREPLDEVNAAQIATEAGLTEADFIQNFEGFEGFLNALQRRFMDGLRNSVIESTEGIPAGYDRARAGALAYLNGCLAYRGLRDWLLQGRLQYPSLATSLAKQNQGYLLLLPMEFIALQWPHPQAGGRLFLSALQEIARIEHGPGRANMELRSALWQFLRTYDGG